MIGYVEWETAQAALSKRVLKLLNHKTAGSHTTARIRRVIRGSASSKGFGYRTV